MYSNRWARPRGLQKIAYFNWGQRAGMFDNRWANASSWTSAGEEMGISPLEIGSKNQNVWKT